MTFWSAPRTTNGSSDGGRDLAIGFYSFMVLSRAGTFVGGAAAICGFLLSTGRGRLVATLVDVASSAFVSAVVAGVLLSLFDRHRVLKHEPDYADLERARRPAARAVFSFSRAMEYNRVAFGYQRRLWLDWLVPAAVGAVFLLPAGMAGGLLIWATLYGTEALLWFLVWRPSLLRNVTSSAHKEISQ